MPEIPAYLSSVVGIVLELLANVWRAQAMPISGLLLRDSSSFAS